MTMYCIPPEEFPEAVKTIGRVRMGAVKRENGEIWDMVAFWNEKNQAVDIMFERREPDPWWLPEMSGRNMGFLLLAYFIFTAVLIFLRYGAA